MSTPALQRCAQLMILGLMSATVAVVGCMRFPQRQTSEYRPASPSILMNEAPLGARVMPPGNPRVAAPAGPTLAAPPGSGRTRPGDPLYRPGLPILTRPKAQPDGIQVGGAIDLTVQVPPRQQVGSEALYVVLVRNPGDEPVSEAVLTCEFDRGLTSDAAPGQSLEHPIGRLLPGESKELLVPLTSSVVGSHCCRFSVTTRDQGMPIERAWKSACVEYIPRILDVGLSGPVARTVGSRAEFNLDVINKSGQTVPDVQVEVTCDAALKPREATAGGARDAGRLMWKLGTLQPFEAVQLQIEFECQVPARRACVLVRVTGSELPEDRRQRCVEISPIAGTLDLQIGDRTDPLELQRPGIYEITVQNVGLQLERDVLLIVGASAQLKLRGGRVLQNGNVLPLNAELVEGQLRFEPVRELPPDVRLTYEVEAEGVMEGQAEVTAELRSALPNFLATAMETTSVISP